MEFMSRFRPEAQALLRVAAGLMFMQHGAQKLFGWFDGRGPVELASQAGLAGVLEFLGGLLIVLGLLTAPVALVLFLEMMAAYFMAHAPQGGAPVENGGELALLYAVVFLFFAAAGPGVFALDRLFGRHREQR